MGRANASANASANGSPGADAPARSMPLLRLFGPPQFEPADGGPAWVLPAEQRARLVAWLALKRGWVVRPELAALLWPEQESRLAFANLRKALHRLHGLPWAAGLRTQGQALRLDAETDVAAFEAALAGERLDEALALYRGELLAGLDEDANAAWTERLRFERERLHAAWRAAALARLQPGTLDPAAAVELAARLVQADPLDEAAVAAQMQALGRTGQVGAARAAFRAHAERLQSDLGLAPGAALRALHDSLGHGGTTFDGRAGASGGPAGDTDLEPDPADAADGAGPTGATGATRAADAAPGAPRAARSPGAAGDFVGRSVEMKRIAELLANDDCAVLVLTGPGGVGKTRLAQQAMRSLAPGFADGAAFIALEDVPTTAELGAQLAAALGLDLRGRAPALEEVRAALAARRMLLVLDNFEHLAQEAQWLDAWSRDCPRVKLLVTSRTRPVAQSAWTLPIEGLPCPEPEDGDRVEAFDAVRLFVRAARRVEPALVPAAEAAAIVDICRQVEGLPLALELAASFTRMLSCEAIASELREGTELLRMADPARPARQASMEAVFEQSWRHLVPAEREALVRLALFRGGFTAAAARSVAGVSLPVLAALADKSLLRKEGARCHLHPLLQQLALQRLDGGRPEGPERARTAAAHAQHFLRWLAETRQRLRHADPLALREADAEFDNLRAAWRFGARHGPAELLRAATYSLMTYGDHRARRVEALALLQEALEGDPAQHDERLAATLRASVAQLDVRLDRYARAEALALQALAVAERTRDLPLQQQCTNVLGTATARVGRLDDARRWFERALRHAGEAADVTHRAATFDNLALIERIRGRLDESLALGHQGLRLHREMADAGGEAQCLNNLGVVHILRGEPAAARERLQEARGLCERHGLKAIRAMVEVNLANMARSAGEADAAVAHATQGLEASLAAAQPGLAVDARQLLCAVALGRGDLAEAEGQLHAALECALPLHRAALLAHLVHLFAELLAARGEAFAAARVMAFVLDQQPGLVGRERDEAVRLLRRWTPAPQSLPAWDGPALEGLAERILAEARLRHAALTAELRGG